jgi:hypothetical protein
MKLISAPVTEGDVKLAVKSIPTGPTLNDTWGTMLEPVFMGKQSLTNAIDPPLAVALLLAVHR